MVGLLKLELRAQQAALGRLLSAWAETNHIANPGCGAPSEEVQGLVFISGMAPIAFFPTVQPDVLVSRLRPLFS